MDAPIVTPFELQSDQTILFKSGSGFISRFCFRVSEAAVVRINTWRQSGDSHPKLFLAIDDTLVSPKNHLLKSTKNKENSILVYPEDLKFKTGLWYIAIEAHNTTGEHIFGVKVLLQ